MGFLLTVSAKGSFWSCEISWRPPPPTASCLKRDEPDPLSNDRQPGVRRTNCGHVIVVVWANPLLSVELMHHQVSRCTCTGSESPLLCQHRVNNITLHRTLTVQFHPVLLLL